MSAKFSILAVAAMPIIPIALACGGDDGGTIKIPDAAMVDAPPIVCAAEASYTSPASVGNSWNVGSGVRGSGEPHNLYYISRLQSTPLDVLYVDLWAGYGVFTGTDITAGTFQISGGDTNVKDCGLCIFVVTDVTQSTIGDWYIATSGSVTLTNVSMAGNIGSDGSAHFAGTLSNIVLKHLNKSAGGGPADPYHTDGCSSMIPSATMDAAMIQGSAADLTGGGESARMLDNIPVEVRVLRNRRQ
jgi:hypothetical protein